VIVTATKRAESLQNATDQAYSSLAGTPLLLTGMKAQWLQAPRTYGGTLRYNF
jgi:hypothetical protein